MPLLFSYGTLQQEAVQRSTFGRAFVASSDTLPGYELATWVVQDPEFVALSGKAEHAIVRPSDNPTAGVPGTVLELTEEELALSDSYEPEPYRRIRVALESGRQAWVYTVVQTS